AQGCAEPGAQWEQATPAAAGMDAARLQAAVDRATLDLGLAVRVYRHGCLVQSDRLTPVNQTYPFQSWSVAKSVTSMVFGRAWTLGLISPDDPLGSLIPEADEAHGAITMRHLLTQTSGLSGDYFLDYNVFVPDRLAVALTTPVDHPPGQQYWYSQSGVALLAEAIGRAAGEDVQAFAQRELFGPLGIEPLTWNWSHDLTGHTQGFFGVNMLPDDFARLGELMRRGGVWRGERLLAEEYVRQATTPTATNRCYGWLIWLSAGDCNADDLPDDMYNFAGLFGQLVTVMPTQGIVVVRLGLDPGVSLTGGGSWESELYRGILASVTDQPFVPPGEHPPAEPAPPRDPDVFNPLANVGAYVESMLVPPLPPAGPSRARAAILRASTPAATDAGVVNVELACPARWPGRDPQPCNGAASLGVLAGPVEYDVAAGDGGLLPFQLTPERLVELCAAGSLPATAVATNRDAAAGTTSSIDFLVVAPPGCNEPALANVGALGTP
ncbi:MAG: serine hydrolase domain-containing protein, partial [Acidimicrobiales bacterium]